MSKSAAAARAWLMKSEPDVFSFADLRKRKSEPWSGVRNYQARNFMRDEMRVGDLVLFYHSSCEEPGVQGLGRVASKPYADPTQFDRKNDAFEPRATKDKPVWWLVDVAWYADFARPVTLPMRALIDWMAGSHSGVVGLPLYETRSLLRASGYPLA